MRTDSTRVHVRCGRSRNAFALGAIAGQIRTSCESDRFQDITRSLEPVCRSVVAMDFTREIPERESEAGGVGTGVCEASRRNIPGERVYGPQHSTPDRESSP